MDSNYIFFSTQYKNHIDINNIQKKRTKMTNLNDILITTGIIIVYSVGGFIRSITRNPITTMCLGVSILAGISITCNLLGIWNPIKFITTGSGSH